MAVLEGVQFLMSEVPLYLLTVGCSGEVARQELELQRVNSTYQKENCVGLRLRVVQGYLAQKKTPTPLSSPYDPRHRPTVGSSGGAFSCQRNSPVLSFLWSHYFGDMSFVTSLEHPSW